MRVRRLEHIPAFTIDRVAAAAGLRYDGRREIVITRQPAALADLRERTVAVGAPSFEQLVIARRVGWVVAQRVQAARA